jgi:LPXTG-site transpeptidase (sortase) family protein
MPKTKKSASRKTKSSPRPPRFSRRTLILLALGITLLFIPSIFYLNQSIQLMFFTPHVSNVTVHAAKSVPTHLSIPTIKLSLPIAQTTITKNSWEVSNDAVSHLQISANPGNPGPIIMYSHNTNDRFGPIRWLKKGNEIIVTTKDGSSHRYRVSETKIVNPDELSVFFTRDTETLFLYTCDGFADLKRFIVIAEPIK